MDNALILTANNQLKLTADTWLPLPALILNAGERAAFRFAEFFRDERESLIALQILDVAFDCRLNMLFRLSHKLEYDEGAHPSLRESLFDIFCSKRSF